MPGRVNPCRPGFNASCSLCCGSHNYTVSIDRIEEIFIKRCNEKNSLHKKHPEDSSEEKLVHDGMQCPLIGISESEPWLLSCLIYSDSNKEEELKSFFNGTCRNFFCTAWHNLTERHILFAAELMQDWYYYSLLINSPDIIMELCAEYDNPDDISPELLAELKINLTEKITDGDFF